MTEAEAMGVSFEIDHYIPHSLPQGKPLKHTYSNLIWSCAHCNRAKSDEPPVQNRPDGTTVRLFRPDEEAMASHFDLERSGVTLVPSTPDGEFSELVLNLNRKGLRTLRELRRELYRSDLSLMEGLRALLRVSVDQLHPRARGAFLRDRANLQRLVEDLEQQRLGVLQRNRSAMVDRDPEHRAYLRRRREYLKSRNAIGVPPLDE